ncbi:2322_t:CDS:2, partial [Acaulospora colombiana]
MAFHESRVVLIETGRRVVRAGLGLGELLHVPSVAYPQEILARVGLRRSNILGASTSDGINSKSLSARVSDYLVGSNLDDALENGDSVEIYWPFSDGKIVNWPQAEAIWMFFERFNVAGFTYIERPLASLYAANLISGVIIEINQDETDYITCFESQLHHGSSLVVPIGIRDCERYLGHILRSNVSVTSAFSSADEPMDPQRLDELLVELARFLWQSGHIKIPMEGEREKEEEGNIDIAAILVSGKERTLIDAASTKKKGQQAKADKEREMAALDIITVQFRSFPPIVVGKERHRFCEPLFDPQVLANVSIPPETAIRVDGLSQPLPPVRKDPDFMVSMQTAVHTVVKAIPFAQRPHVYFGLLITGPIANIQ